VILKITSLIRTLHQLSPATRNVNIGFGWIPLVTLQFAQKKLEHCLNYCEAIQEYLRNGGGVVTILISLTPGNYKLRSLGDLQFKLRVL
jgi:hypothetical protein